MTERAVGFNGWANHAIAALGRGEKVVVQPRGHSMAPRIKDRQAVALIPLGTYKPQVDDVVLVRVKGRVLLHLIKAVDGERVLIGNNRGGTNGWVSDAAVYGLALGL